MTSNLNDGPAEFTSILDNSYRKSCISAQQGLENNGGCSVFQLFRKSENSFHSETNGQMAGETCDIDIIKDVSMQRRNWQPLSVYILT